MYWVIHLNLPNIITEIVWNNEITFFWVNCLFDVSTVGRSYKNKITYLLHF